MVDKIKEELERIKASRKEEYRFSSEELNRLGEFYRVSFTKGPFTIVVKNNISIDEFWEALTDAGMTEFNRVIHPEYINKHLDEKGNFFLEGWAMAFDGSPDDLYYMFKRVFQKKFPNTYKE